MTDSKGSFINPSETVLSRETSWMEEVESRRVKKCRFSEARLAIRPSYYCRYDYIRENSLPLRDEPSGKYDLTTFIRAGNLPDLMTDLWPAALFSARASSLTKTKEKTHHHVV